MSLAVQRPGNWRGHKWPTHSYLERLLWGLSECRGCPFPGSFHYSSLTPRCVSLCSFPGQPPPLQWLHRRNTGMISKLRSHPWTPDTHFQQSTASLSLTPCSITWHHTSMSQIKLVASPCLPETCVPPMLFEKDTKKSKQVRLFHLPHLVTKISQFSLKSIIHMCPLPSASSFFLWRLTALVFYCFQSVLYIGLGSLFLSSASPARAPNYLQCIIQMF